MMGDSRTTRSTRAPEGNGPVTGHRRNRQGSIDCAAGITIRANCCRELIQPGSPGVRARLIEINQGLHTSGRRLRAPRPGPPLSTRRPERPSADARPAPRLCTLTHLME